MTVFTLKDMQERLPDVLDALDRDGQALLAGPDGSAFEIRKAEPYATDWTDVGIETGLTLDEILSAIRESREREYPWMNRGEDPAV